MDEFPNNGQLRSQSFSAQRTGESQWTTLQDGRWILFDASRINYWWALIAVALICGTAALEFWAVGDFRNHSQFRDNAGVAWGTIIEIQDMSFDELEYLHTVEFEVDGITFQFEDDVATSKRFETGSQYQVLYDPADPTKAELHRPNEGWLNLALYAFLGLIMFAYGARSTVLAFQPLRKRKPIEEQVEHLPLL